MPPAGTTFLMLILVSRTVIYLSVVYPHTTAHPRCRGTVKNHATAAVRLV